MSVNVVADGPHPATPAREAYRLWAGRYDAETVVSALDDRAVRDLTPPLATRSLLDAACGTGRRLPRPGAAARAIGVDLVYEMLAEGRRRRPGHGRLAAADLRALPFADARFDVVWCRLAIGHIAEIGPVYRELARVARPGAHVIVTDFHPEAARAGHARTFRDAAGHRVTIEHHVHLLPDHERAARDADLALDARRDLAVGPGVRSFYERAGKRTAYEAQRGLRLVLALRFRRCPGTGSDRAPERS